MSSYFTVNVSSPNTPGLRDLQQAARARRPAGARDRCARPRDRKARRARPLLLKIAPDLTLADLDDVVGVARRHRIDGMIVANTTIKPAEPARTEKAREQGGLSGRPLFALSTRMLAETYVRVEGAFPLIGVGRHQLGRRGLRQDQGRREAGAALQRPVFRGIGLVGAIKRDLLDFMRIGRLDH